MQCSVNTVVEVVVVAVVVVVVVAAAAAAKAAAAAAAAKAAVLQRLYAVCVCSSHGGIIQHSEVTNAPSTILVSICPG